MTDEQAKELYEASVALRATAIELDESPAGVAVLALAKELMTSVEDRRLTPLLASLAQARPDGP